jgi:hypothetical protein
VSELTPCNYCTLRGIRRMACERGHEVTLAPDDDGISVYVHPPGHEPDTSSDPMGNPNSPYFTSWFMALSEECVC